MATQEQRPSFGHDIRPLFRPTDVSAMKQMFDLSSYDDVRGNAANIYEALSDGSMPCDGAWPSEQVQLVPGVDGGGLPAMSREDVRAKRVYEPAAPEDGYRVLVDHIWPRGVSKERAKLDEWAKELAPSEELREWFNHVPERFPEFRRRYRAELKSQTKELDELRARARKGRVTVVYAARDEEHNNGIVVAGVLRDGS